MIYLSILIFLAYIIPVLIKYGIPTSLSETYYTPFGKLGFSAEMILLGLSIMPSMLDIYDSPLSFFACVFVCFVGAAPYSDKIIHFVFAIGACILSQIVIAICYPQLLLFWILALLLILCLKKYWLLIMEIFCIILIFILGILL